MESEIETKKEIDQKFKLWLSSHYPISKSSQEAYLRLIDKFIRDYNDECNYDNIIHFVLATNPKTSHLYTSAFSRKRALEIYYEYKGKKDLIEKAKEDGIFRRIKLPKALLHPKVFSSDDFQIDENGNFDSPFFDRFKNFLDSLQPDARVLMMVLWDTASRISPILKLKKKDIHYNSDGTAEFSIVAKGGKKYKLYLSVETAAILKLYSAKMKDDQRLFFRKIPIKKTYKIKNKFQLSYGSYYMELKHKSLKTELVSSEFGISPHWIRTAKAHYIYKQEGNDILAAKAFLHHENLSTTERYLNSNNEEFARKLALKNKDEKW